MATDKSDGRLNQNCIYYDTQQQQKNRYVCTAQQDVAYSKQEPQAAAQLQAAFLGQHRYNWSFMPIYSKNMALRYCFWL